MFKTVLTGFVMGFAMLLPSLSIGSVALIFGQYEKILQIVSRASTILTGSWNVTKKETHYIITLLTTILLTALLVAQGISAVIEKNATLFESIYIALILGASIHLLQKSWSSPLNSALSVIAGFSVFTVLLLTLSATSITVPLSIATFIAGMAMVLPGVSGSFMLYVFGAYDKIIELLTAPIQNIRDLAVLTTTILLGAALSIKTVTVFLNKKDNLVILFFTGVLLSGLTTISTTPYIEEPSLLLLSLIFTALFYYGLTQADI